MSYKARIVTPIFRGAAHQAVYSLRRTPAFVDKHENRSSGINTSMDTFLLKINHEHHVMTDSAEGSAIIRVDGLSELSPKAGECWRYNSLNGDSVIYLFIIAQRKRKSGKPGSIIVSSEQWLRPSITLEAINSFKTDRRLGSDAGKDTLFLAAQICMWKWALSCLACQADSELFLLPGCKMA